MLLCVMTSRAALWNKAMLDMVTKHSPQALLHHQPAECMTHVQLKLATAWSQCAVLGDISTLNAYLACGLASGHACRIERSTHRAATNLLLDLLGSLQGDGPPALVAHPLPWVGIWCPGGLSPLHPSETPA